MEGSTPSSARSGTPSFRFSSASARSSGRRRRPTEARDTPRAATAACSCSARRAAPWPRPSRRSAPLRWNGGRTACPSGCGWRSTPARSPTWATSCSGWPCTTRPGCSGSLMAARCCCRARRSGSSRSSRRASRCATWDHTGSGTSSGRCSCTRRWPRASPSRSRRCGPRRADRARCPPRRPPSWDASGNWRSWSICWRRSGSCRSPGPGARGRRGSHSRSRASSPIATRRCLPGRAGRTGPGSLGARGDARRAGAARGRHVGDRAARQVPRPP